MLAHKYVFSKHLNFTIILAVATKNIIIIIHYYIIITIIIMRFYSI